MNLTYYLMPDLLPWEREGLEPMLQCVRDQGAKGITVTDADKGTLKRRRNRAWVLTRDWRAAHTFLGGGDYFSLFDSPILKSSPSTILWRSLFSVPSKIRFIAHSPLQFRFLTEIQRISPERVTHLPLPIPAVPSTVNVPKKSEKTVGVFGEFSTQSNLNYFMNVAHYVTSREKAVKFVIMGRGALYAHLARMADEMGIRKRIEIVETDEMDLIRHLDILLYLPLRNMHFLPLLGAAACKVPVLATEIEGISGYLNDGQNGFVLPQHETKPMGELILRLTSDAALAEQLGAKLHTDLSAAFDAKKLFAEYAKVLGMNSPKSLERAA